MTKRNRRSRIRGDRLAELRVDIMSMTQPQIAELADCQWKTFSKYENDTIRMHSARLDLLLGRCKQVCDKKYGEEWVEERKQHFDPSYYKAAENENPDTAENNKKHADGAPPICQQVAIFDRSDRKHNHAATANMVSEASKSIWLISEMPLRVLGLHFAKDLMKRIEAGCEFRILMLDPESILAPPEVWPQGDWCRGVKDADEAKKNLRAVCEGYCDLVERLKERKVPIATISRSIQIRGWKGSFPFGLLIKDHELADDAESSCRVEYRLFDERHDERPNLLFRPSDSPWYGVYSAQFERLWKESRQNPVDFRKVLKQLG